MELQEHIGMKKGTLELHPTRSISIILSQKFISQMTQFKRNIHNMVGISLTTKFLMHNTKTI